MVDALIINTSSQQSFGHDDSRPFRVPPIENLPQQSNSFIANLSINSRLDSDRTETNLKLQSTDRTGNIMPAPFIKQQNSPKTPRKVKSRAFVMKNKQLVKAYGTKPKGFKRSEDDDYHVFIQKSSGKKSVERYVTGKTVKGIHINIFEAI